MSIPGISGSEAGTTAVALNAEQNSVRTSMATIKEENKKTTNSINMMIAQTGKDAKQAMIQFAR